MRVFGILLVLILVNTCSSFGQNDFRNGFIVNLENDTIFGQVDYRPNSKNYISCLFKGAKATKEYYPKQILGFGYIDDKFFSSQIVKDTFVEALVIGELSLYKSTKKYFLKKDTLVYTLESKIKKVEIDDEIKGIESSKWRGITKILIGDCLENPFKVISKITLSDKSLVKLIIDYNKCKGVEIVEFKANKPWTKVDFGVSVGIVKSEIFHSPSGSYYVWNTALDDYYSTYAPSFGLVTEISSPRLNERISTQVGINFMKSSFSSTTKVNANNTYKSYIDLSTLSIPISVHYNLPVKGLIFDFQGGVNFDYQLNSEAIVLREGDQEYSFEPFQIGDFQFGFWLGIGIEKYFGKTKIGIALRRFNMSELTETNSEIPFKTKKTTLSLFVFL